MNVLRATAIDILFLKICSSVCMINSVDDMHAVIDELVDSVCWVGYSHMYVCVCIAIVTYYHCYP